MYKLILTALVALICLAADPALGAGISTFTAEAEAQQHCPKDTVVWLNLPTGINHFSGERWYGRTKSGAYVCQKEADAAGDRAMRNGQ